MAYGYSIMPLYPPTTPVFVWVILVAVGISFLVTIALTFKRRLRKN